MAENPDPIDLHVGRAIRALRHTAGLTQVTLAEAIGVQFQQLQKYETAQNRISASRLKLAADALSVSVADFFRGLSDEPTEGDLAAIMADPEALRLARTIHALPPLARTGVQNILAAMSESAA